MNAQPKSKKPLAGYGSTGIILLIIMSLWSNLSKAQSNANPKPNASFDLIIKNSPLQTLILTGSNQRGGADRIDSVFLSQRNGIDSLHYEVSIAGIERHLHLFFNGKKFRAFIPVLAAGEHLKVTIDLNKQDDGITFSGSARTQALYNFFQQQAAIYGKYPDGAYSKYMMELKAGSPDSSILKQKIDSINKTGSIYYKKTILRTECSYLASIILSNSLNSKTIYSKEEFNLLREKFKDDFFVSRQLDDIEKDQVNPRIFKKKPANGTYLTDITLPDTSGRMVSLAQFKGKYVLVDFWASWCIPCRAQSPYLKKARQEAGGLQFVLVSISMDKNQNDWRKAIVKDGLQAIVQLIDESGSKNSVSSRYNIESIPSNFLLDPAGKIIA